MEKQTDIIHQVSYVRKCNYIVDIEIDMKIRYKAEKLKLTIRKNGRKLKEISGRYTNKNFGAKVNDVYAQLYKKLTTLKPQKVY
jgi:hypothetical protein